MIFEIRSYIFLYLYCTNVTNLTFANSKPSVSVDSTLLKIVNAIDSSVLRMMVRLAGWVIVAKGCRLNMSVDTPEPSCVDSVTPYSFFHVNEWPNRRQFRNQAPSRFVWRQSKKHAGESFLTLVYADIFGSKDTSNWAKCQASSILKEVGRALTIIMQLKESIDTVCWKLPLPRIVFCSPVNHSTKLQWCSVQS